MPIDFPPLNPEMQAQSDQLQAEIRLVLQKAGGVISFAEFMALALYAPGLGYYAAGAPKFGPSGDFVTAPEISPLFAKCLAKQFAEVLAEMPESAILELGAGSGRFALEVLLALEGLGLASFPYFILEPSANLRQRQQALFQQEAAHLLARVNWLDKLPESFQGLIFGNEVLDALPVHRFRMEQGEIKEVAVGFENQRFDSVVCEPLSQELKNKASALMHDYHLPEGYESEINLALPAFIESLAKILTKGLILFFDYGYGRQEYYHPERNTGTLRCYYQHHCHNDPFCFIGAQDLTTQVDFTTVVESAMDAGLELAGYTTQSSFLLATGVGEQMSVEASPMKQYQESQALKLLMLPSEMGTLIKAMALSKGWAKDLLGFSLFDKRHEL